MSQAERPLIMHQTWGDLLFLHWRIDAAQLRDRIPSQLELDTFENDAWIGLTPFTMWDVRLPHTPALPMVSRSHELNVRTYVRAEGVPGIWFFSLDANNPLAVGAARLGFGLTYYQASIDFERTDERLHFVSRRMHPGAPDAHIDVAWQRSAPRPPAQPGTLDYFLTERYALYAVHTGRVHRTRIRHAPWPLHDAQLHSLSSTMIESHGLMPDPGVPVLHAQGEPLQVEILKPETVGG